MSDIKWVKLYVDLFKNRKIKQINAMPNGDAIINIWLKLLCLCGELNDYGRIYLTEQVPYSSDMLAIEFEKPVEVIEEALKVFETFQMIEVVDGFIFISNWEKYQAIEGMEKVREQNRIRQQRWYEKHNVKPNVSLTLSNALDKELELEKEKDVREKNKSTNNKKNKSMKNFENNSNAPSDISLEEVERRLFGE